MNPIRSLLFSAVVIFLSSSWCAAEERTATVSAGGRQSANFVLLVWASDPTDELKLAAESLRLPVHWNAAQRAGLALAALVPDGKMSFTPSGEIRGTDGDEGYEAVRVPSGELVLAARSQHGLANGLYDARRALLVECHKRDLAPAQLLSPGEHKPYFARRETYQFLTTWNLPRLTGGTFTVEQWKTHLRRMRALNVNHFYFDTWADQYYHPDYPETYGNKAVYDRLRAACDYAHRLGIRTGVYAFPCQVPTWAYLAHPEAKPVEISGYHGLHLCPSRNWKATVAFTTYLIGYFGKSLDDVVVEMQDPGSCLCAECCRQFPELVLRFMDAYRRVPGGPADRRIDLCPLHFRDWLEDPATPMGAAFPIKNLRQRVFDKLPPQTALYDLDDATLDMGRERHLKRVYFFFDLDAESGLENCMVLPRVKLRRIESQVKESVARKHDGIMAYRTMPFAQHVADYALFRKCWDPGLELDAAMTELAAEWGVPPGHRVKFVKAMRDLDAWWEEGKLAALKEANSLLQELAAPPQCSEFLVDLRDQVVVLAALGEFRCGHRDEINRANFYPPAELVERIYGLMLDRRIFEAYTVHQHWTLRAKEMIGQRLRWWLQAMTQ